MMQHDFIDKYLDKIEKFEAENKKLRDLLIRYNENTAYYGSELAGSWLGILADAKEALK